YYDYITAKSGSGTTDLVIGQKIMRREYVLKPYDPEKKNPFAAPEEEDILVGANFSIKGRAVQLYFEEEVGMMRWKTVRGENYSAGLIFSNLREVPDEIHRKKYFQSWNTLRTFGDNHLQDSHLGINREITKQLGFAELIKDGLDKLFSKKLDKKLM
ncbi:MAG: hypothetical protein AAFV80_12525, partial [Bacteroidota bacterium]